MFSIYTDYFTYARNTILSVSVHKCEFELLSISQVFQKLYNFEIFWKCQNISLIKYLFVIVYMYDKSYYIVMCYLICR